MSEAREIDPLVKFAVTDDAWLTVRDVLAGEPDSRPDQPVKQYPEAGTADRFSTEPAEYIPFEVVWLTVTVPVLAGKTDVDTE